MSSKVEDTAPFTTTEPISFTVKYGKGYDESWVVFRGNIWQLRADIIAYFGIDVGYASGLTLHELGVAATHVAHGTGAVAKVLNATPISATEALTGEPTGDAALVEAEKDTALPYGGSPTEAAPADPNADLIQQLQTAASIADLKALWVKHQAAFTDADVKAAYSKRGKALKAAEKAAA